MKIISSLYMINVTCEVLNVTGVPFIECQSNDPLLTSMLYEFAQDIHGEAILFEDHSLTMLPLAGAVFSRENQ
jgi:hypothetical protein